ncbi:type II toxin-antitoxin system RelE/ParE family toxin [Microcoleus sp. FACHB-1515]|uniref:type II toxin-antitoxin system RelE family toxin n=1 Tax=Cyanophyceae TaxID=3028117 RepID=UPI0016868557|nr:type II toxin-antitoxin system RelE/ParE family toxin [Microcoleus sp. FACHB-1515]MBD2090368.1 type II toxin-antitoxin system RelE/ParE family toxin [Microcoleus sp. FACHB-1515]
MPYQIQFATKAAKQFKALPANIQQRIQPKIDALADTPLPSGVVKLEASLNLYRIRIGDYRVIYELQDKALIVLVVKVGHRRNIYRD